MSSELVSKLPWLKREGSSSWGPSFVVAVLFHLSLVWIGLYSPKDTLFELIENGETLAVVPIDKTPAPQEVEVELTSDTPPPESNPEFVVPIEPPPTEPPPQPVAEEPPQPPQEVASAPPEATPIPPPTVASEEPKIDTAPVAPLVETAPSIATDNQPIAPVDSPPASNSFAPDTFVIGDKNFPKPPYPLEARVRHYQGTVCITIEIENGKITDVVVTSSSGYHLLDRSTAGWIKEKWKFPVQLTRILNVPIRYELPS